MKKKRDCIYQHSGINTVRRLIHQAVLTDCRPVPDSSVQEIYAFEVLSATGWNTPGHNTFSPNVFIDISQYLDTKRQALEAYNLEIRPEPHTRSITNIMRLAEFRGNTVGLKAAEGFGLIRRVV